MSYLVTRYNEYTNDLEIIAITSSSSQAHKLISKDIDQNGKGIFRKQKGNIDYQLVIRKDIVNLDNVLTYTITNIPMDELINLKTF